jgi:hypothetical protein
VRHDGRERRDGRDGRSWTLVALAVAVITFAVQFLVPFPPFQPLKLFSLFPPLFAQTTERGATDAMARRVNDRVRALQAEADRLALQVRTLLGDLRQLELQRDIAAEQQKAAAAAVMQAQVAFEQTTARLNELEQQRASQLPDLKTRLVDIYKRGRGGYARMAFDVRGLR